MSSRPGVVLALLTDSALHDELDRVAAAVGVRAMHVEVPAALSRRIWIAAAAVVVDEAAARRCAESSLPRRAVVILVTTTEPGAAAFQAAIAIGAEHVLTLPRQESVLVRALSDAGESAREDVPHGQVVGVIAGRGGAGASVFAAALAQAASDPLLVDLDPWGGGIELLLGSEATAGLRWPDLAVQGGRLNWPAVRDALPCHRGVSVLSGTRRVHELDVRAVDAVIDAGRRGGATVLCDVPRRLTDAAVSVLDAADLLVVVGQCDVRACAATSAIATALRAVNPNIGLVVRGPSPGGLRADEVARISGLPLLAAMRPEPLLAERLERGGLRLRRRSPLAAAARQVLTVLHQNPLADAA